MDWSWDDFLGAFKSVGDSLAKGLGAVDEAIGGLFSGFSDVFEKDGKTSLFGGVSDLVFGEKTADSYDVNWETGETSFIKGEKKSNGLLADAMDFTKKNPEATKLLGTIGVGIYSGYQQEKNRELQQSLANQRVEAERQLLKDKYDLDARALAEKRARNAEAFNFKV